MSTLSIQALQTRIFHLNENLLDFILESVPSAKVKERMVLAVTSKIVSLAEGRVLSKSSIDKATLVEQESDHFYGEIGYGCFLTVKEGLLIPSAGIDESNSENGDYILYPQDPYKNAENLWKGLKEKWNLKELGILLTDSHTSPLRRGVTGIALSYYGFKPIKNLVGSQDLFGRELRMTQINYADALAASSVMLMGEGKESRPLALIYDVDLEFTDQSKKTDLQMPLEEDLYLPLFQAMEKFKK